MIRRDGPKSVEQELGCDPNDVNMGVLTPITTFIKFFGSFVVAVSAATFIIVLVAAMNARADRTIVVGSIEQGLESGRSAFPSVWKMNLVTGIDTYTDCLVLNISTFEDQKIEQTLSRSEFIDDPLRHPCDILKDEISGLFAENNVVDDYWRYWWGSSMLLNIVVGYNGLSVAGYQNLLLYLSYASIGLALLSALYHYRRAALPLVPVALGLVFGFGLPIFGQSIAHAPGLIFGMLALAGYPILRGQTRGSSWNFGFFAFVGCVTFYLELLNGNLVVILLCSMLIRLLGARTARTSRPSWPGWAADWPTAAAVLSVAVAMTAGAVSMVVLRIGLRVALTQQTLSEAVSNWASRMGKWNSGNSQTIDGSWLETVLTLYYHIGDGAFPLLSRDGVVITYGLCALLYAAVFFALIRSVRSAGPGARDMMFATVLIVAVIPAWYSVFLAHTIHHPWMMMRLLAPFFALAPAILLLAPWRQSLRASPTTYPIT